MIKLVVWSGSRTVDEIREAHSVLSRGGMASGRLRSLDEAGAAGSEAQNILGEG